jgi:hypothetical protein
LIRFVRNALSRDPDRRLRALGMMANRLLPGYRLTWSQLDWWDDQAFNDYLDKFDERRNFNTHRHWTLWQLAKLAKDVSGDTAECGVYLGASSWLMCQALGRPHHVFDSFEGLSRPLPVDGKHWKTGALAAPEDAVARNLQGFDVHLYKGWIPDRFPDVADKRFAMVHVDVDLYEPTRDSIAFFYPRLNPGAVFVCDDYGFGTCPGATKAIDEFMADKPEPVIAPDAGGGFFIKL